MDGVDLIVTMPNGSVLVLTGFFASTEAPPQLSILDGPAVPADDLLARAEAAPMVASPVDPAAGQQPEPAAGQPVGGAGAFRAYEQGSIGPGLDPLGPLGPTEIGFGAAFPEGVVAQDEGHLACFRPIGGEPHSSAPAVELRTTVEATIGEETGPGFNPITTPVLPIQARASACPTSRSTIAISAT